MALPEGLRVLADSYFKQHGAGYNMKDPDECGRYMEAFVPYAQNHGYPKVGHLKKTGSGTQYNGHAIDSFLYNEPVPEFDNKLQSCDIINSAETDHASSGWSPDTPRYTEADWMHSPDDSQHENMVPWVPYDEKGFEEMKRQLAYDYARRPQGADFDVSVWAARVFHNAFMGPEKNPLGMVDGTDRAKHEWCAALQVAFKYAPADWKIGDPV